MLVSSLDLIPHVKHFKKLDLLLYDYATFRCKQVFACHGFS